LPNLHLPRLLADECVYQATSDFVRGLGCDLITIQDANLAGAKDKAVIELATDLERVLLTRDLDFSNVLIYPPGHYLGIIVLKIAPSTIPPVHYVLE
jgi:predicted nuclease of predicted toxin-antitoxin system